jgi:hypothetical protein
MSHNRLSKQARIKGNSNGPFFCMFIRRLEEACATAAVELLMMGVRAPET